MMREDLKVRSDIRPEGIEMAENLSGKPQGSLGPSATMKMVVKAMVIP